INMWTWVHTDSGRKIVRERIRDHEAYLALSEHKPIATFAMQWADEATWGERGADGQAGYIHGMAVSRIAAGKGIGAALIQFAQNFSAERRKHFLRLDCMDDNPSLCAYYEKLGFKRAGVKQGTGWSAALYEKT